MPWGTTRERPSDPGSHGATPAPRPGWAGQSPGRECPRPASEVTCEPHGDEESTRPPSARPDQIRRGGPDRFDEPWFHGAVIVGDGVVVDVRPDDNGPPRAIRVVRQGLPSPP